jgi:hypothetical protein
MYRKWVRLSTYEYITWAEKRRRKKHGRSSSELHGGKVQGSLEIIGATQQLFPVTNLLTVLNHHIIFPRIMYFYWACQYSVLFFFPAGVSFLLIFVVTVVISFDINVPCTCRLSAWMAAQKGMNNKTLITSNIDHSPPDFDIFVSYYLYFDFTRRLRNSNTVVFRKPGYDVFPVLCTAASLDRSQGSNIMPTLTINARNAAIEENKGCQKTVFWRGFDFFVSSIEVKFFNDYNRTFLLLPAALFIRRFALPIFSFFLLTLPGCHRHVVLAHYLAETRVLKCPSPCICMNTY